MVVGLILEANPYHNGHKYLVNQAKLKFPDSPIIAITSTSFTMRGEISLLDKFQKTKILLNEGIDLVFELPISFTLQSADYFAYNTVYTLYKAGITDIIIGCEDDDENNLKKYHQITTSNEFKTKFKENLHLKISYKSTFEKTLQDLGFDDKIIELFNSPNMTLALSYYKVIMDNNLQINLHLIKRTTDYYQKNETHQKTASASYIRELYQNGQVFCQYLPYDPQFIDLTAFESNIMKIINFQILSKETEKTDENLNGNTEGILNFILQNGKFDGSFKDLMNSLNNKRYSFSRIRRVLLSYLLNISSTYNMNENYLRLLGLSSLGSTYLSTLPKKTKQLIFSNPNELKKFDGSNIQTIFAYEISSTKLFGLLTNNNNLYLKEYQLPIKKEGI